MKQSHNPLWIVAALSFSSGAHASNRAVLDIKTGRLGEAIVQLGQQTGSSIGISDQRLTRIAVKAVRGRLSVDEAIRRLLKGKPARIIQISERSWRIEAAPIAPISALARASQPHRPKPLEKPEPTEFTDPVEIIVMASKRETSLRMLPATVSVLNGDAFAAGLDAGGTAAILEKLPSVTSTHAGAGRNKLFIRGIADSGFAGPTQATVGQYFGEMRINYNAPDPDLRLYDVSSVEVPEGPQGTLYGAGSLAGIIRANPCRPNLSQTEAFASYAVAGTGHGDQSVDGHMALNIPLVLDRIAVRLLSYGAREGSYIDDIGRGLKDVNGIDVTGGRAIVGVAPNNDWRIDFSGIGQSIPSDDAQYAQRGLPGLSRLSPVAQAFGSDYWLANVQVQGDLGELRLISSVGIVDHALVENYDATRLRDVPTLFHQQNQISLFSTEHLLSQNFADDSGWLIGASYIRSTSRLKRTLNPAPMSIPAPGIENHMAEWALFGEATLAISDNVRLTVGGRLSSAMLSGSAFDVPAFFDITTLQRQAARTETTFLPSVAVAATPRDNFTAFLRFQQGFRPGGLAIDGANIRHFRNDRTSTVESGFRFGDFDSDRFAVMGTIG
jgi:iron complex outermembrane recepter protein